MHGPVTDPVSSLLIPVPPAPFTVGLGMVAVLAGLLLGWVYFGGLWWTLSRLPAQERPYGWMALSFVVRSLAVVGGFGLLLRLGGWWPPVLGLAGFVAARWVLVRRWGFGPHVGAREEAQTTKPREEG